MSIRSPRSRSVTGTFVSDSLTGVDVIVWVADPVVAPGLGEPMRDPLVFEESTVEGDIVRKGGDVGRSSEAEGREAIAI